MARLFRDAELSGWSTRATTYDELIAPITNQVVGPMIDRLGAFAGQRVLDVCCGPGHLAGALAKSGAVVEGIDFAVPMILRARANYPDLVFREGDAEALPFEANAFDHVVCGFGLMHLSRPDTAISEAFRVLRSGGRYVFTQWAQDDELLKIVLTAISDHGESIANVPHAPPPMRFGDPEECRRSLNAAGFSSVQDDRIETTWQSAKPEALLDIVYRGAVRAAMLLEAQPPARRARIHDAISEAARRRMINGSMIIRRPVVMASGVKR